VGVKLQLYCHELGWPEGRERLVRQIIASEAMLWPHIVCSVPGAGYFCATDFEEALTYRNWLADLRDQAQLKLETFEKLCAQHGLRVAPVKRRAA
jgi:hypothetical protein